MIVRFDTPAPLAQFAAGLKAISWVFPGATFCPTDNAIAIPDDYRPADPHDAAWLLEMVIVDLHDAVALASSEIAPHGATDEQWARLVADAAEAAVTVLLGGPR